MNIDIYGSLFAACAILLASAVASPLVSRWRKTAGWVNFILVAAAAVLLISISIATVIQGGVAESTPFGVGPVSVYFLVDGFSGFFIALISFMAVMSALYSISYMDHYRDYHLWSYYLCFPLFILGMIGIVTVDDLTIGFTAAWQMMTIASYFLIRFEYREKGNVRNANKYLALMELAWVLILAANLFVEGASWGDPLHAVTAKIQATKGGSLVAVFGLLLLGFGFKAGMFPFGQLWLPDAHSIAPSPVSALLSGVMIKTGVYGIIRSFFWMAPAEGFDGLLWGILISSIGVATLFIGTVQSLKQIDIKRLLAYSSIGQVGYIILGIGSAIVLVNTQGDTVRILALVAIVGAIYHTINHAVFKGLLFMSAGSVLYATGTKDMNRLGGLMKMMPATAIVAGIASLSISGVPAFSGFASKWTIISADILAGGGAVALVLFGIIALFTSAVTLAVYVKFFGMIFASSGVEWNVAKKIEEVPATMLFPKFILALLCLVQGLLPFAYYTVIIGMIRNAEGSILEPIAKAVSIEGHVVNSVMGVSITVPGMKAVAAASAVPIVVFAVITAAMLFAWLLKRSGGAEQREKPAWLCGYQELHNKNRYVGAHMFAAFRKALWWTGGNVKK